MNKITFGFLIAPLATGISGGLFTFIAFGELSSDAYYAVAIVVGYLTIASYVGVLIAIPIYFILKKLCWINIYSILCLGMFCSLVLNIYPAYINYQIDIARGLEITVTDVILSTLTFAVPIGMLSGFFLWYFGIRGIEDEE